MIDIKELRRLAQLAVNVPDGVSLTWIKHLQDFQQEVGATVVLELLDRLEVAEKEALEQARVNGMGSEREASLMAKLESAKKERDTLLSIVDKFGDGIDWIQRALQAEVEVDRLRARVEVMERQEPVAWMDRNGTLYSTVSHVLASDKPLYLAPGAKGE